MRSKVLAVAAAEVGYMEKATPEHLDSKTANAGDGNYTKYWRDLYPPFQGQPWCDCFVDWCFHQVYGAAASGVECGGDMEFFTPTSAGRYQKAGRWVQDPEVGAQIFFENGSRICHTGLVESFTETTVTTIEGNTSGSSGVISNGGEVCRKTYFRSNDRIAGYGLPRWGDEMIYLTPKKFIEAVKKVCQTAREKHYRYGDSHAMPPTTDGVISCDRMIAKALWDLGYTDQPSKPTCGLTVINMEDYLTKRGWKKITKASDLKAGDIVLMRQIGQDRPTAAWHTFVITKYDPKTGICSKYDEGSQERINTPQPFVNVPLNQWQGQKQFYCGFRCPQKEETVYNAAIKKWKKGDKGNSVLLVQKLLRDKGYRGKDGKTLKRDGVAGVNTCYALRQFRKDCGYKEADSCTIGVWRKLLKVPVEKV